MKFITVLFITAFTIVIGSAQALPTDTTTFKVSGNCDMCKKRIETSLKKSGIYSANWNMDTKQITVVYDSQTIVVDDLHKLIALAGYDTEKMRASEKNYNKLPECCQYERSEK